MILVPQTNQLEWHDFGAADQSAHTPYGGTRWFSSEFFGLAF
jgi:hypothetical protein